jgi:hypothetical protein
MPLRNPSYPSSRLESQNWTRATRPSSTAPRSTRSRRTFSAGHASGGVLSGFVWIAFGLAVIVAFASEVLR